MSKKNDSILLERLCELISEQVKNAQEQPEEQGETSTAHGKSLKEYIRRLWQC